MTNRKLQKTVKVAGILFAWWIFSVTAGIYNKAYLDIYSMPIFLTVRKLASDFSYIWFSNAV